jgi:hypothetical protein
MKTIVKFSTLVISLTLASACHKQAGDQNNPTPSVEADVALPFVPPPPEPDTSCQDTVLPKCQQTLASCQQDLSLQARASTGNVSKRPGASKKAAVDKGH